MNCRQIYEGVRKCVVNDYPFELIWKDKEVFPVFSECYETLLEQHSHINNSYYSKGKEGIIRIDYLDHYVILCYRFAKLLNEVGMKTLANAVYYSCRVRGSIDLYYTANIGKCFMPVHAVGTIVDSHAKYGDYFKIYDNCHIGPYSIIGKDPSEWEHPTFGDYVTVLGHTEVYGNTIVGNNVVISTGTRIINEEIPDNCIVSGTSPNLVFQKLRISNSYIHK